MTTGQKEVLNTEILKARVTKLEYGNGSESGEFISISSDDIRRVYIEETGKEPPQTITVYKSDDFKTGKKDSGFDGTVIHFFDSLKGINQSYTIPRGTEEKESGGEGNIIPPDWVYNALGIFTGKVSDQFEDAKAFEKWANKEINTFVKKESKGENIPSLRKIGMGHSLGGNHIQMLYLQGVKFDNVYAMNDAAPTIYQLSENDRNFFQAIQMRFRLDIIKTEDLYALDPKKLQSFAESYYKSKGANINHITSKEDILYPLHLMRGFLRLGEEHTVVTNPDLVGLDDVIRNIPDKKLQSLQEYLAAGVPYYEEAGVDGFFYYVTGMDNDFLKNISTYVTGNPNIDLKLNLKNIVKFKMKNPVAANVNRLVALNEIKRQLPAVIQQLKGLSEHIPVILQVLNATSGPKGDQMSDRLLKIKDRTDSLLLAMTIHNPFERAELLEEILDLKEAFDTIKHELEGAKDAHLLEALINGLSDSTRRYEEGDMIYIKGSGKQQVEVNVSSAKRLYWMGMDTFELQSHYLREIQRAYSEHFETPYEDRCRTIRSRINDMESNPKAYNHLVSGGSVVSISVNENISPIPPVIRNNRTEIYAFYKSEFAEGKRLFESMRQGIEKLFSEEKQLSSIFKYR